MPAELTHTDPVVAASHDFGPVDGVDLPVTDATELTALRRRYRSTTAAVVVAALQACLTAAGPDLPAPERRAVVLGTATGAGPDIESFLADAVESGDHLANPALFPMTVHNATAGHAAVAGRCRGPNIVLSAGAESVWVALEAAHAIIDDGSADLVVVGGFESVRLTDGTIGTVAAMLTLCADPATPLPRRRSGPALAALYRPRVFRPDAAAGTALAVVGLAGFVRLLSGPATPAPQREVGSAGLAVQR